LLGYLASGSLIVAVLGQLAASLTVLALHDIRIARKRAAFFSPSGLRPSFDGKVLRQIVPHALPLALAALLVMVTVYLPRLVVERTTDLSTLGYFAAITALAMAPNRLVNSLGIAVGVRLARQHAAGERGDFLRLLSGMVSTVALVGAVGIVIAVIYGDEILSLIYTSDYAQHSTLFAWAVGAAVLRSVADVLKFGMIASRRFWTMCVQYGAVALVACIASLALIPRYGVNGAGIALVVIFAAHVIVVLAGLFRNLPRATLSGAAR
jgi:O-antigen/teichoic acid export membrane protein